MGWKPHDKSWSMGDLASHIVNMIKWTDVTMNQTELDMATVSPEQMNPAATSRAQLLEWFDAHAVRSFFLNPCRRSMVRPPTRQCR
jgi:hypothetical protein